MPHTEGLAKFSLYNVIFLVAKLFRLSITLVVHPLPPHQINGYFHFCYSKGKGLRHNNPRLPRVATCSLIGNLYMEPKRKTLNTCNSKKTMYVRKNKMKVLAPAQGQIMKDSLWLWSLDMFHTISMSCLKPCALFCLGPQAI